MKMWIPLEYLDWIRLAMTHFQKTIKFTPVSSAIPQLDLTVYTDGEVILFT